MQVDEDNDNFKPSNIIKDQEKDIVHEELKQEYLKIEKQKELLEIERKKFAEAAVKLGKERALLTVIIIIYFIKFKKKVKKYNW